MSAPVRAPAPRSILVAYRGIPHNPGWETGACLARAFEQLGHTVHRYGTYFGTRDRLESSEMPHAVDLLVYCECSDPDPQYDELRKVDAPVRVYWDFDIAQGRERQARSLARTHSFDVVFHANRLYGEFFRTLAPRAVFLPYAFDPSLFHPAVQATPPVGVGLVGSLYRERQEFVEELLRAGVDVELVEGVFGERYVAAINRLKIHLNLNLTPGGRGILVSRIWETIGCGPLLLTQRRDGIEELFDDGRHVALFDGAGECAEKIAFYLEHDDLREQVARAGHERGLEQHTYVARARTILDHADDYRASAPARHRRLRSMTAAVRTRPRS